MKTFLLVLSIVVATAYGGPGHRKHPNFEACLAENELTKEQFNTLKKSGDPKVGCIFACTMAKDGTMTDSTIELEKIKEKITAHPKHDPKFIEIATNCVSEVQSISDKCEKAAAYKKCFHSKMRAEKPAPEQQPSE